jgi:TolB-like protein/Flp pilus assembly protein TadD
MSGFFEEIKRRKVYRVAAAYAVVAAGAIQLASAIFPAWELPSWTLRLVIILLLIGFPISLILAWALEVTPQGIRATPQSPMAPRRRRNIIALVAIGVIVSGAAGIFLLPRASARKLDKSIAVLPFESFSDDKENAFFADGIQDDILTNLSKIGDLRVISRTSVMPYRGKEKNVREIGKALGVSTLLEGSVRKDGNRVRVNVQLINAGNDEHIWSEVYDRDLTDVFAIQTDLAQKIAKELQAKLSPSEKAQMTRKPTENGEAYLAFVQAHTLHRHLDDNEKLLQAEQLYERALHLDPNFALAAAQLSRLESWIFRSFDPTPARRDKARTMAERALALQPDSPEGHLAFGFTYYYGDRDYGNALKEFAIAQRGLPNDAEVYLAIGAIQRRQGKWKESNANLEKAVDLNPNDTWPMQNLALNYEVQRVFGPANKTIDRALKLDPDSLGLWSIKAQLAIAENGNFEVAKDVVSKLKPEHAKGYMAGSAVQILLLQRKFEEALRVAEQINDELLAKEPEAWPMKYTIIGIAKRLLGDEAGAREALLTAKRLTEKYVSDAPNDAARHSKLAAVLAWLGEKDAAIAEGLRATELLPESVDAFDGPKLTEALAEVYCIVGEQDKALDLLDHLLSRPSFVTIATLKVMPMWDWLRHNPRFDALLKKHGG